MSVGNLDVDNMSVGNLDVDNMSVGNLDVGKQNSVVVFRAKVANFR
jgi:hypothetical protein